VAKVSTFLGPNGLKFEKNYMKIMVILPFHTLLVRNEGSFSYFMELS
jgi:hypothetical protein